MVEIVAHLAFLSERAGLRFTTSYLSRYQYRHSISMAVDIQIVLIVLFIFDSRWLVLSSKTN